MWFWRQIFECVLCYFEQKTVVRLSYSYVGCGAWLQQRWSNWSSSESGQVQAVITLCLCQYLEIIRSTRGGPKGRGRRPPGFGGHHGHHGHHGLGIHERCNLLICCWLKDDMDGMTMLLAIFMTGWADLENVSESSYFFMSDFFVNLFKTQ